MDFGKAKPNSGVRTLGSTRMRWGWTLLLSLAFVFLGNSPVFAQEDTDRCRGDENFIKCHQERYAKALRNKGNVSARLTELNKARMPVFQEYVNDAKKRQTHLQGVQSNARRAKERIIEGVDRIIKQHKAHRKAGSFR